jgi:hypothetical protein
MMADFRTIAIGCRWCESGPSAEPPTGALTSTTYSWTVNAATSSRPVGVKVAFWAGRHSDRMHVGPWGVAVTRWGQTPASDQFVSTALPPSDSGRLGDAAASGHSPGFRRL